MQLALGAIQLLRWGVGRGPSKCEHMRTGGRAVTSMRNFRIEIFLIKHLVHKLLTIVTRFPVLLKISVLKNDISFAPKITNQLRLLRTINLKYVSNRKAASEYRLFVSLEV